MSNFLIIKLLLKKIAIEAVKTKDVLIDDDCSTRTEIEIDLILFIFI